MCHKILNKYNNLKDNAEDIVKSIFHTSTDTIIYFYIRFKYMHLTFSKCILKQVAFKRKGEYDMINIYNDGCMAINMKHFNT